MGAAEQRPAPMNEALPQLENLVLGLGKTGLSCARHLARLGRPFAIADTRAAPPGRDALRVEFPRTPLYTGAFDARLLAAADRLIVSPGLSLADPAIRAAAAAGVVLTGDIALFRAAAEAPVIAVTGSNGKSTVATLVHEMLLRAGRRSLLGGNIGTPALDLLEEPRPDFYVLELSSFQLELVPRPDAAIAALLNVTPDHMDRYGAFDDYLRAKARVFAGAGTLVVNRDDARVAALHRADQPALEFTLGLPPVDGFGLLTQDGRRWLAHGPDRLLPVDELRLRGLHNTANALAACAICHAAGVGHDAMRDVLREFAGLPHRCRHLLAHAGVDWFDDSKGTNPGATAAAIQGIARGRNVVLIAGGDGKGADFTPLAGVAQRYVRCAVLIGRDARLLATVLEPGTRCEFAGDMTDAVQAAARAAQPGDAVLLSPACASFDMFDDYRHRGLVFAEALRELSGHGGTT
jgi:UDP-N-acetylmuramoylalanine--D-glutamate ligase